MANNLDFSIFENKDSKYIADLPDEGGYINFCNSSKKYFTLGLPSWIASLTDLRKSATGIRPPEAYSEKEWRDYCAANFTDLPANAMSTVQTKPIFVVLSKIIMAANDIDALNFNPENEIMLTDDSIDKAIIFLKNISSFYSIKINKTNGSDIVKPQTFSKIRDFAKFLFEKFYSNKWGNVISDSLIKDTAKASTAVKTYDFKEFNQIFISSVTKLTKDELSTSGTLRYYEDPIKIFNNELFYFSTQWNGEGNYSLSFDNLKKHFEENFENITIEKYNDSYILNYIVKNKSVNISKPFVLLAGISGTGKSRFVKNQTEKSNYCLVPVRPDWHEPSDLLGYISNLGNDGPTYKITDTLIFIVKAWKNAYLSATKDSITLKNIDEIETFWLCLDEMNLAPVEQYFADYLSILETRSWDGSAEGYSCYPIFKIPNEVKNMRIALGLNHASFDGLWDYFTAIVLENDKTSARGIPLPPNLIVAGTVNMDETTHGFSRKVIDRALTFDFGEFFPNDYENYFDQKYTPVKFNFPTKTHIKSHDELSGVLADTDGKKSIAFLASVNQILKGTPFELAYRALNELLLAVYCQAPKDDLELQAVWDDFIMMKVLPRIEGDNEKLLARDGSDKTVIEQLEVLLSIFFQAIADNRTDFFRVDSAGNNTPIKIRSITKLKWMQKRLANNGFTSFWP